MINQHSQQLFLIAPKALKNLIAAKKKEGLEVIHPPKREIPREEVPPRFLQNLPLTSNPICNISE
jgi:uncharacterized membrane protein YagU involved in acid resistance